METKHYIFDVDDVIADPETPMDPQFMRWFEHWMLKQSVYLCTNNTYQNLLPRLGRRILDNCVAVFTCGGNSVWVKGREAVLSTWRPPTDLIVFLESYLNKSQFKFRSGPNIEYKTGMITFTVAGKLASEEDRKRYAVWDRQTKERNAIIESIEKQFPTLSVCRAGETGIDITPGSNKSQILEYFKQGDQIVLVGHDFSSKSADKPLKTAIEKRKGSAHQVQGWNDTYKFLLSR